MQRFVEAQKRCYERVLAELCSGRKQTHWMWFVFPQLAGLGQSAMSRRYAIRSLDEASEYVNHPLLGARLRTCTQIVNAANGLTAEDIFGAVDAIKFRSSMTLFACVGTDDVFRSALRTHFENREDVKTLELLRFKTTAPQANPATAYAT